MRIITAVFAIAFGLIVLLGYFVTVGQLANLRLLFIDWAMIIAGMAVLVGIFNIAAVQLEKIRTRQKGSVYGALLVMALLVTFFGFGVFGGPEDPFMRFAADAIIVPVEAALTAILAVTLVYASIRLLRRRVDVMSVVFLVAVLVFLSVPLLGSLNFPLTDRLIDILDVLPNGGARGLLIGIALGVLLTGLRVLFGIDRPYGGN